MVAVARQMGRHYIGIESGPQVITHCIDRLRSEKSSPVEDFRFFLLKEQADR